MSSSCEFLELLASSWENIAPQKNNAIRFFDRMPCTTSSLRNILTKFKLYQFNALTVQNHSDLIKKEIYALVVDIAKLEKSFY